MNHPMAAMALELSLRVQAAVGAELAKAAAPGPDVVAVLQREPQLELQALLDLLEPVAPTASASLPFEQHPNVGDDEGTADRPRIADRLSGGLHSPVGGSSSAIAALSSAPRRPRRTALEHHGGDHDRCGSAALGAEPLTKPSRA